MLLLQSLFKDKRLFAGLYRGFTPGFGQSLHKTGRLLHNFVVYATGQSFFPDWFQGWLKA
jgi:hypothetical protein